MTAQDDIHDADGAGHRFADMGPVLLCHDGSHHADRAVRRAATMAQVPCITTLTGASAAVSAIKALRLQALTVRSLQDYYAGVETGA